MERETVGKIATDLQQIEAPTRDPIELQREMQKGYLDELLSTTQTGKKLYTGDFFVVVLTKKERLLPNVLRNYFLHRKTCPTPTYDQAVYHFIASEDELRFLWVVPSKDTCQLLRDNALQVHDEERQLRDYVLQFYDGSLDRLCLKLNPEEAKYTVKAA